MIQSRSEGNIGRVRPHAHTVSHSPLQLQAPARTDDGPPSPSPPPSAIMSSSAPPAVPPRRPRLTTSASSPTSTSSPSIPPPAESSPFEPPPSESSPFEPSPSETSPSTPSESSLSTPSTSSPAPSTTSPSPSKTSTSSSGGHFNFLAFRRAFTTKELTTSRPPPPRPALVRQKSYFLEEHMSFKDCNLKASDLTSLPKILKDKVGMVTFRNFLKSIYAEENLKFWCDVIAFKKDTPPDQKVYEARKIYVLYIHEKASYPLNVAATTRSAIEEKIEDPDCETVDEDIFDEAQEQAYDLMHRDCFPRFRKSPYFYRLQEGLDENFISSMVKKTTGLLHIFRT